MKRSKETNRRYYLHTKLKMKYNARSKTVYVPWEGTNELPPPVLELHRSFNYAIQTEID